MRARATAPWFSHLASVGVAVWAAALAMLLWVTPGTACADTPRDVPTAGTAGITPQAPFEPALPSGYLRRQEDSVTWIYPSRASSETDALATRFPALWRRITDTLSDAPIPSRLVIGVATTPEDMVKLAPPNAPPPAYASGVAYPALGLVLLTLTAPETWERPPLEVVFAHELSHVALFRTTDGRDVPRWFTEGLAIHQSDEASIERLRTLWEGTVRGELLPLEQLSGRFPSRPHAVNLAYAQSANFVGFMLGNDEDAAERLRRVLLRVKRDESFESAVRGEYGRSLGFLETDWRTRLERRYTTTPLLLSGGGLWVLAAVLVVVGYARRKRKERETLRRWEAEDAAIARSPAVPFATVVAASRLPEHYSDSSTSPPPIPVPPRRDGDVPTIVVDGVSHTLH